MQCVQFVVTFIVADSGGSQGGFIRAVSRGDKFEGAPLYDTLALTDTPHDSKSSVRSMCCNSLRMDGQLVGVQQLWARFFDSDAATRARVRSELTRVELRGKNVYSVEENKSKIERGLQCAMATDAELAAGESLVVSSRVPSRFQVWNSNKPSSVGTLMGLAYHMRSGLLLAADSTRSCIHVVKVSHHPCDLATLLRGGPSPSKRHIVRPMGLALQGTILYVTDPGHDPACIWWLDVARVLKQFSKASEVAEGASSSEQGGSGGGGSATTQLASMHIEGWQLGCPHGIAADPSEESGTLYVTDRVSCSTLQLVRVRKTSASAKPQWKAQLLWSSAPAEPMGIALVDTQQLAVAAGDAIYVVPTALANAMGAASTVRPVLCIHGSHFVDVSVAPSMMRSALYVIDASCNAVRRLQVWSTALCATSAPVLVGGNTQRPEGSIYGEGTAAAVKLFGPTFGAFAANTFFFTNSGDGPFGKLLQLTNVVPLVTKVMPAFRAIGDACCVTDAVEDHAFTWLHMALKLQVARDFVIDMEEQNRDLYTNVRGLEGPGGNVSNSLRLNLRSNVAALHLSLSRLAALGIPQSVMDVFSPKALTTLPNERYHIGQRRHSPMPSALEWVRIRALNIQDEAAFVAGGGFSDWHGERRSRTHYLATRAEYVVRPVYQLKKRKEDEPPDLADLAAGREFVGDLRGPRCRVPTDRGKEQVGTHPGIYYQPVSVKPITSEEAAATLSRLLRRAGADLGGSSGGMGGSSSTASSSLPQSQPILFAHSLVYIKPNQEDGVWIAELREGLSVVVTRVYDRKAKKQVARITMSSQRLRINYFRPDNERPPESEGVRFVFAYEYTLNTWEAIWDVVHGSVEREMVASKLRALTISVDEYERAVELVSGQSGTAPPIAVEFEELLKELGAWEKSSSEDDSESSEDEAARADASRARYEEIALRREKNRLEAERRKRQRQMKKLHLDIFGPDDSDVEQYNDVR